MNQPYFLGSPQWQHPNWSTQLPPGHSPLDRYSRVFNTVEGNTTFYATPTQEQCRQWRSQVPGHFRFLFKFPRAITHDQLLTGESGTVAEFLATLSPLADVMGPMLLQLPSAFGPEHLDRLWRFIDSLPETICCTVEIRHPAFFQKGDAERQLNRGLRERQVARVCFDSRALFSTAAHDEATRDAQRKKPRLPVHVLPVEASPVVRFIGHPSLEANRPFLAPWVSRFGQWIEQGLTPYMFLHMPDNGDALSLATLWSELLRERLPRLEPLPIEGERPQLGLFGDG